MCYNKGTNKETKTKEIRIMCAVPTIAEIITWIIFGAIAFGVFAFFNYEDNDEVEMNEYRERDICRAENSWERSLR